MVEKKPLGGRKVEKVPAERPYMAAKGRRGLQLKKTPAVERQTRGHVLNWTHPRVWKCWERAIYSLSI